MRSVLTSMLRGDILRCSPSLPVIPKLLLAHISAPPNQTYPLQDRSPTRKLTAQTTCTVNKYITSGVWRVENNVLLLYILIYIILVVQCLIFRQALLQPLQNTALDSSKYNTYVSVNIYIFLILYYLTCFAINSFLSFKPDCTGLS